MSDLKIALPILSQSIGSEPVNAVNARDLHRELEIGQMFAHWIKAQIERAQLVEGVDYMLAENSKLDNQQLAQGQQKIDYIITIDAAKSVAMMSQTEKGAQVRRYFIEAEKALRNPVAALTLTDLAKMVIESEAKRIAAEEQASTAKILLEASMVEKSHLRLEVSAMQPKAAYFDNTLSAKNSFPITVIAKSLGLSAVTLNAKLKKLGIQYKVNGTWCLTSKYQNKGYGEMVTHPYKDSKGETKTSHALNWTEAGRLFIVTQLEKHC